MISQQISTMIISDSAEEDTICIVKAQKRNNTSEELRSIETLPVA
jgi:hypothetical protein